MTGRAVKRDLEVAKSFYKGAMQAGSESAEKYLEKFFNSS